MSDGAEQAAAVLEGAGEAASLWFAFGGDPDAPELILGDRAADPRGQSFLPAAKALAEAGAVTQGIASRKGGGALTVISRLPFEGLVGKLAAWAAAHVGAHRGLLGLKDLRYVQVSPENKPVDQQSDPLAWDALDAAVQAADAAPEAEADAQTEATLAALASGAETCWFWLAPMPEEGPPVFVVVDRAGDPRGAAFGAAMKDAIEAGTPNPGSVRGILNLKADTPPMCVGRTAYPGFIDAMMRWFQAWRHLDGAERIEGIGYTQLDAQNQLVERQVDPGAWAEARRAEAEAAGEVVVEPTEADACAELVEGLATGAQLWFWLGRGEAGVEVVLRSVDKDPGRSDFDRGVLKARERLGGEEGLEQSVGRARKLADGAFVFQSVGEFKDFTVALQRWVVSESADAPGLAPLVGARFQYVSEQGHVFQEQAWPSGAKRSERSRRAHSAAEEAPAPAPAPSGGAALPEAEELATTRRALDGTRVDLEAAREAVDAAIETAASLLARDLQELANEVEHLAAQAESWLEQRADWDDARAATRALRREAWGEPPTGEVDLPELDGDASDAAEDARDLGGAMVDAEEAAKAWRAAAKGPPFSARNPLDLPDLSVPAGLRGFVASLDAREAALDAACAAAEAPAGGAALAEADGEAGDAREDLVPALLDLAADAIPAAEALRSACDKLEQHGESRRAFPDSLREKFDRRCQEMLDALTQLSATLMWLTRSPDGD